MNTCKTSPCKAAPRLFNHSASLDADIGLKFNYLAGSVSGEIYWEQVTLGNFSIGYQSFGELAVLRYLVGANDVVAAEKVVDEDMGGGNFSGLLGLACSC